MIKSIVELILVISLLAIASYYGKNDALMPPIWWILGIIVVGFRLSDLLARKKSK